MGRITFTQGKGSLMHNRREYEKIGKPIPDHINASKMHENIKLIDKDIRQAYDEYFGEALKEYNAKQKRKDRKIESYYDHIKKSGNNEKVFYENVVQWGSMEDFKDPETRKKVKEAYIEFMNGFEKRNPNLKLIGAYVHMDESSPHLHFDYIPIASGFKNGLKLKNSLTKAMKQMGFEPDKEGRNNNATMLWKKRERAVFADICRECGLVVDKEEKARGKNLSPQEYKRAKDKMSDDIKQEHKNLIVKVEQLEEEGKAKDKEIAELKDENKTLKVENGRLWKMIREAFGFIANIVKAVKMLKYDRKDGYKAMLTKKQEHLIDGISDYGVKCAIDADFPEVAKDMDFKIGISEDINKYIEQKDLGRIF